MSGLTVGGVAIPIAAGGIVRSRLDLVDRARSLDGTMRQSSTGTAKREWKFITPPLGRELADFYESVLNTVSAQTCSGDVLGGSQNRLLWSEGLTDVSWNNTNVTVTNSVLAPNGTSTAFQLVTTGAAATTFNQSATVAATSATFSTFVKISSGATDANKFGIRNSTTATDLVFITYNYTTGAIAYTTGSTGASVETFLDGWVRLEITASSGISSGNTIIAYNGFTGGVEGASKSLFTWGLQLDASASATPYTKTTSAAVDGRSPSCFTQVTNDSIVPTPGSHRVAIEFMVYEA